MENNSFNRHISIEWNSVIRDLIKNSFVIFEAALIGLMCIYVFQYKICTPEYKSSATLAVSVKSDNSYSNSNFGTASEMAKIFAEIFSQPSMKVKAAENLGKESFDGVLTASAVDDTNLLQVSVGSSSPQNSYALISSVLEVYPEISDKIFRNAVLVTVSPPQMAHTPVTSFSFIGKLLTEAVCIFLATAAIFSLSVLRDTVKSEADFCKKIDAELLGSIPHKQNKRRKGKGKAAALLKQKDAIASLRFTEDFNKITAKLEYMNRKYGDKVFAVMSVAEKEGKSTVAAKTAISLEHRGKKVLLLDFDHEKPSVYKTFGIRSGECSELDDLFSGRIGQDSFYFGRYKKTGLFFGVNTEPHKVRSKWYENGTIENFIEDVKEKVDFVIIDTASLSADASVTNLIGMADKIILTVRADTVKRTLIADAVQTIKAVGGELAGCVLNDVYPELALLKQTGSDEADVSFHLCDNSDTDKNYVRYAHTGNNNDSSFVGG